MRNEEPLATPTDGTGSDTDDNLVVQAESLFATYLNARLRHATKALEIARRDQRRDPWNALRRSRVREADRLVDRLRTELASQQSRIASARREAVSDTTNPPEIDAPVVSADATSEFRESQVRHAERISAEQGHGGGGLAPFLTREEFADLRRVAAQHPSIRRRP